MWGFPPFLVYKRMLLPPTKQLLVISKNYHKVEHYLMRQRMGGVRQKLISSRKINAGKQVFIKYKTVHLTTKSKNQK